MATPCRPHKALRLLSSFFERPSPGPAQQPYCTGSEKNKCSRFRHQGHIASGVELRGIPRVTSGQIVADARKLRDRIDARPIERLISVADQVGRIDTRLGIECPKTAA